MATDTHTHTHTHTVSKQYDEWPVGYELFYLANAGTVVP